jgi:hypothetical protein
MVPDTLWLHPDLEMIDTHVWMSLLFYARDRMECSPTNRGLAEMVKVGVRSVKYSLVRLQNAGFISIESRGPYRTIRLHPEGNGEPIRFALKVTS